MALSNSAFDTVKSTKSLMRNSGQTIKGESAFFAVVMIRHIAFIHADRIFVSSVLNSQIRQLQSVSSRKSRKRSDARNRSKMPSASPKFFSIISHRDQWMKRHKPEARSWKHEPFRKKPCEPPDKHQHDIAKGRIHKALLFFLTRLLFAQRSSYRMAAFDHCSELKVQARQLERASARCGPDFNRFNPVSNRTRLPYQAFSVRQSSGFPNNCDGNVRAFRKQRSQFGKLAAGAKPDH